MWIRASGQKFVELEKLLPKDRSDTLRTDGWVDLINKDGQTYFVPHQKETRINGVRKWEQAFRVYAAIYSSVNPTRAAEIWLHVHTINMAASSYIWEDVAYYDYTFRQLMSQNPARSWAKLYNQMWNLSMRNPLQHQFNKSGDSASLSNNMSSHKKTRNCWKFNKGRCSDPNCKFPHKCNYCDGKHGIHNCFKRKGNMSNGSDKQDKHDTFNKSSS